MKRLLSTHPLRNSIALQLRSHPLLADLHEAAHAELARLVTVHEVHRGERLLEQGSRELSQFFVIEGLLKRVVTGANGREMTLRFAGEHDMESCFEAWQQGAGSGFSVVGASAGLVVSLSMADWCDFLERHAAVRQRFQERLVQIGAAIVEHAVGLLLLDAPSRVQHFSCKHRELADRLTHKELASFLNLSAETFCRVTRRHRPALQAA
ncbi:Crp/Fnr family transcriptional regulator [Azohydromonas aeria]|uniref:Crp/Fnr family transcriptional regulator n=1 Tax=Azohydromonas aeria TaxID=2590212 RepID=UPI0012FA0333|nr:Crp/Fnr family transcriptional regulator [Azohydromonas aeria]